VLKAQSNIIRVETTYRAVKEEGTVMAKPKMSALAETRTEGAQVSVRTDGSEPINEREVAMLAYPYWQERGSPIGSPEEDWFRAEQALQIREGH
jgi:Protein of unknown function (DUF2934)